MRASRPFWRVCQQGFSLVELMVAMVLGLVILLAVSELFISNTQTRSDIERTSRQLENGRFAIQLLIDEISNAGYFGEAGAQPFPASEPPPCVSSLADLTDAMGVPVFGGDSAVSCADGYKSGTDYIAFRRSSTCSTSDTGCAPFDSGAYHIQVAACMDDTVNEVGTILLSNSSADFVAMTRACDSTQRAPVYRYLSRLYYINEQDELVRAELGGGGYTSVSLVEGIERMALEYGVDTDADGAPDTYEDAGDVSWVSDNVVSVKVWVLARALEESPGYANVDTYRLAGQAAYSPNDGFRRQLFSTVVKINNVAGRLE